MDTLAAWMGGLFAEVSFMTQVDYSSRTAKDAKEGRTAAVDEDHEGESQSPSLPLVPATTRSTAMRWFLHDIPFIAMPVSALLGLVLRLPVSYWIILTPVFGVISIAEGWSQFETRGERLGLVYRLAAIWCALLLAIYLLYNGGVQGVMNANATSLAMVIVLALGTFVAGVQARVWQICGIGAVLFLAVPGLGWLDQSPLILAVATCFVIALSGFAWWVIRGTTGAVQR